MNNKCYAKFMADVVPLIEALLNCEKDAEAPHTPSGQLKAHDSNITTKKRYAAEAEEAQRSPVGMPCKKCGNKLKGRWDKDLKRWTLFCPECKRIRYKSTDVGSGGKESYVEVDLPWKAE